MGHGRLLGAGRGRLLGAGRGRLLGAALGCALVLGLSAGVRPASADDLDCPGALSLRLPCLARQAARAPDADLLTVERPVQLGRSLTPSELSGHREQLGDGLTVEVPARQETGPGGSVLLLLAAERRVAADSRITPLDAATLAAVREAGLCTGKPERSLCTALAREQSGADLVRDGLADPLDTEGEESGTALWILLAACTALLALTVLILKAVRAPAQATGSTAPARAGGAPAAVPPARGRRTGPRHRAGTPRDKSVNRDAAQAEAQREAQREARREAQHEAQHEAPEEVREEAQGEAREEAARGESTRTVTLRPVRNRPAPPDPYAAESPPGRLAVDPETGELPPLPRQFDAPAAPPRPRAVVRSALHPEGYVEIDRCLYRARWIGGPAAPPPPVGAFVDVRDISGEAGDGPDPVTGIPAPHLLALPGDTHDA
ncbi:hypothetical protein [Streptomyces indicus]|uniref:Uncharacterized protein n=1 Tax=Streptomyces indicus TaxID=417292 RepID=A0A1G9BJS7_9ACTN|nr:hypothetical protein [Streptomyces indicus]SDK39683.1 hypothetical protein SAMN05421806_10794 [Streptomyces indicus]